MGRKQCEMSTQLILNILKLSLLPFLSKPKKILNLQLQILVVMSLDLVGLIGVKILANLVDQFLLVTKLTVVKSVAPLWFLDLRSLLSQTTSPFSMPLRSSKESTKQAIMKGTSSMQDHSRNLSQNLL